MPRTIHVITPVQGTGNRIDLELVAPLLEQNGFEVTCYAVTDRRKAARFGRLARTLARAPRRFDVNIFLGPLFPEWLPFARKNILVPNPEGSRDRLLKWLPRLDLVLAKTRWTESIFKRLRCRTEFTSFTSRDHFDGSVERDYTKFFHACSSGYKGTQRLLEAWKAHPEWPELVLVISTNYKVAPSEEAPNIRVIADRMPDAEYSRLQNSTGFHVCCSEAEGFGHYLMEALSCGAITFATNAPPMNELVQPSRGILVDCLDESAEMNLSRRYFFNPKSLEEQIRRVMKFDAATIAQISSSARAFYLENDRWFRQRFVEVIQSL